jgi:type VI secretion system protein ImpF
MSRLRLQQRPLPSLLERLIDPESAVTAEQLPHWVSNMLAVIGRDLEELLNTRRSQAALPEEFAEVRNSLLDYGLPEQTFLDARTGHQLEEADRVLLACVDRFEPRLQDVRTVVLVPGVHEERRLRFRIDARLAVDPAPEVAFEADLDLMTGHWSVRVIES